MEGYFGCDYYLDWGYPMATRFSTISCIHWKSKENESTDQIPHAHHAQHMHAVHCDECKFQLPNSHTEMHTSLTQHGGDHFLCSLLNGHQRYKQLQSSPNFWKKQNSILCKCGWFHFIFQTQLHWLDFPNTKHYASVVFETALLGLFGHVIFDSIQFSFYFLFK